MTVMAILIRTSLGLWKVTRGGMVDGGKASMPSSSSVTGNF